jgi:alpha-L-rhamnosidase
MKILLAFSAVAGNLLAATVPTQLRCEYRENPLGVDVARPRLSWQLTEGKQTAYQVVVDGLWDSGRIESDEMQTRYAGQPLRSSQRVSWKVRVWPGGKWSRPATWTMGVLDSAEWRARWISAAGAEKYARSYPGYSRADFSRRTAFATEHPDATSRAEPNYSSMVARREFAVKAGLVRAVIHVSGLGQYEVLLNGKKVGDDILSPGWTDYRKTVLYDTYDITRQLKRGDNAVEIILGNGMYNIQPDYGRYVKFLNSFGPLKAIAQLRLEYADGSVETVATDESWQVSPGPITFNNIFAGEDYDARWKPAWQPAIVVDGPGGALKGLSCAAPPIRAMEVLKAVKLNDKVYDLGQNASVMPRITVSGPAGSWVRIIPSELLKPDGTVDRASCTQDGVRPAWWQYTLAGAGKETWFPKFFYQGGRYLQLETSNATVEHIEGVVVHSLSPAVGEFSCSNPLFNRIYALVRWAQRSNMMSVLTDCPHREKLGWLEQTHLNGPSLRYNFDMAALFQKVMNDIADSQLENGFVPNIAPEYFIAGTPAPNNPFRNSPEWGGALLLVAWQQYWFSGDIEPLRRHYDAMKRYVAFLASTATNHIVTTGLGDWYDIGPKPPWGSQLTPPPLTATAFYQQFHWILARAAELLGKPDEAKQFDERAEQIRRAFNDEFFRNGRYATGSQCANALPLVMNLVDSTHRQAVLDAIVQDVQARGLTAGDVGYRYLLRALADHGRSDLIYTMNNQSDKPGYGMQLVRGATSLTEKWDAGVGSFGSQNHFMLGQINEWFFHDLAGIQPAEPGFKTIVIRPAVVGDLTWVKASYDSVRGRIVSEWKRDGQHVTLHVIIPANTTATIDLPGQEAKKVGPGEHTFRSVLR